MARFLRTIHAVFGLSLISSAVAFTPGFAYGSTKVRGVNLGGWLVLEVCVEHVFLFYASLTLFLSAVDNSFAVRQHRCGRCILSR
jgi:hypothetical protein